MSSITSFDNSVVIPSKSKKRSNETCLYWVSKKNRNCLTTPLEGFTFCETHKKKNNINILDESTSDASKNNNEILEKKSFNNNEKSIITCIIDDSQNLVTSKSPEKLEIIESEHYPNRQFSEKIIKLDNKTELVTVQSDPFRCHFYLKRKKRFCKALSKLGFQYCVEHAVDMQLDLKRTRIPCPLDTKHSCYEDQLESHLKKCNSRQSTQLDFYEKGINSSLIKLDIKKSNLSSVSSEGLGRSISKVNELHLKYVGDIDNHFDHDIVFIAALNDPKNGVVALKHLKQQSSLIGNIKKLKHFKNNLTYIEFGAGKGGLSHWLQLANPDDQASYFLIDKSSVRYKMDSYHKGQDQGPMFERLKIDIEDLNLNKVVKLHGKHIVGIAKHLCGKASDLMLKCLLNSIKIKENDFKLDGIVLATCCHHRCDYESYVGQQWFELMELTPSDFTLMANMSAWATCASKHFIAEHADSREEVQYNHPRYGTLTPQERELIGFKCKQLIDYGRIKFLEGQNFCSNLIKYVNSEITLENVAIVANF